MDTTGGGRRDPGSNPMSDPAFRAGLRPIPTGPVGGGRRLPAADVVGIRPTGVPVEVPIRTADAPVLLCFLHIRCDGCDGFWHGLGDGSDGLPPAVEAVGRVAVTRGVSSVDPLELERVASGITVVPVVMSDQAWSHYQVSAYPFFVLVDPVAAAVVGETVGFGWDDVGAMVESSLSAPR